MSDFQIAYFGGCKLCGEPTDDPFWFDTCYECDHSRHSVAPWDAPDCDLCWPDDDEGDDWQGPWEDERGSAI